MGADEAGAGDLVFPGAGEMAARMRAYPWSETALGPPHGWPASLRGAIRICLTSRFPMIVWWDSDLRFLYNDAYLPLMGAKHPALYEPGERVWPEIWHIVGPMLTSVLETGEATWSEDQLLPLDRHGYLEETYWTYSYSPLHDDSGAVRGVFTAVRDTTARVIGERRLAVLRELGALAGRARDVEEACRLVARALDKARADVPYVELHLRGPDDELTPAATSPDGQAVRDWPLAEALAGDVPVVVDDVAARVGALPCGSWPTPPAQAAVFPIPGATAGKPVGAVVFAVSAGRRLDEEYVSFLGLAVQQIAALVNAATSFRAEQRRAEQLAELDRAKTAFFSNVSHEFRTPLTLIAGPVDELRAERQRRGELPSEELEVVHRNALRLGKLVNTLLDFSRIEAGRMVAHYEPVDLAAFTAELAGVFRSAFDKAGLAFEVDCPPLPQPVHVDRGMWEKVVLNLLSNALKHTFDGTVAVRLRAEDGQAVLRVSDTGIGITAEEMPRLFERFHRVHAARARSNEGSGIGLALVRELVDLHGGTITARSGPGAGTTFTVRVPFGTRHLDPEMVSQHAHPDQGIAGADPYIQEALRWLPDGEDTAPPAWAAPPESPAVLVADDNADMRDYLLRLLSPSYRVTAVEDGLAALDAVRADPPDLVISDVMMPGMDGLALVGALRDDERTARTPIVLLSARAGQEAAIEGLEAGADDYLVKPFTAAELLARVRSAIDLSALRERHERWRDTLIDSLREAFFVADENGAVIEINAAFTDILGFGADGLPYEWRHPWLPDERTDPEGGKLVDDAFAEVMVGAAGTVRLPAVHRDGHGLWIETTIHQVEDPRTHRKVLVGTFHDVTAEHYAVQTDAAVAAMSVRLGAADTMDDALRGALGELRALWRSGEVVAALWTGADEPAVTSTGPHRRWADLRPEQRQAIAALRTSAPLLPSAFPGAGAGIALKHPDGLLAVLIDLDERRPLSAEDRTLLALLGGHLGQGLHRAQQIDEQRTTALALQRAMLGPAHQLSGLVVRYEPAARPLEVGGDWYDTVELADGRIGIVVGDCVGRGLPAAAIMGQLRSACRALLLQDTSPGQTLMALDRFAAVLPGAMCTTVFCGVLDLSARTLVYSSAGHPPGILTHRDGSVEQLDGGRSTPLAVRPGHYRPEATCAIPPRSTLLLYTDGLIERRRSPLTDGIDRAADALRAGRHIPIGDLADDLMAELAPDGGYDDDVALLLYRDPAPLELSFPALPERLAPVRAALREWLERCEIDHDLAQNVLVAAGEACANAIEHGYLLAPDHEVTMRAEATVTSLCLLVRDRGAWRAPDPAPHRGRGIALMRAIMDDVEISAGPHGTTVEMRVSTE